ncbi:sugar phosphate isomerase/epimerase [bacterium]|nr:sugar phosphate isomerase/epimerase [bacterium]
MKIPIGIIPGIVSDELKKDYAGTITQLAALGYKAIEGTVTLNGDVAAGRALLDSLGMRAITIGVKKEALETEFDKYMKDADTLGVEHITVWWSECATKDAVLKDAELYNRIGPRIAARGYKLCYHNHDHEFKNAFDGVYALDLLLDSTDPKALHSELDVAWVTYGGEDPVAYIKRRARRIPVIHLKDIADINTRAKFTAVGTGIVKVKDVVDTAVACGVKWIVYEQDRPNNLTPMESVTATMLNLKELGIA